MKLGIIILTATMLVACGGAPFSMLDAEGAPDAAHDVPGGQDGGDGGSAKEATTDAADAGSETSVVDAQTDDVVTVPDSGHKSCASTCDGCCVGETCMPGASNDACGTSGSACTDCASSNQVCTNGACACAPPPPSWTCSGPTTQTTIESPTQFCIMYGGTGPATTPQQCRACGSYTCACIMAAVTTDAACEQLFGHHAATCSDTGGQIVVSCQ